MHVRSNKNIKMIFISMIIIFFCISFTGCNLYEATDSEYPWLKTLRDNIMTKYSSVYKISLSNIHFYDFSLYYDADIINKEDAEMIFKTMTDYLLSIPRHLETSIDRSHLGISIVAKNNLITFDSDYYPFGLSQSTSTIINDFTAWNIWTINNNTNEMEDDYYAIYISTNKARLIYQKENMDINQELADDEFGTIKNILDWSVITDDNPMKKFSNDVAIRVGYNTFYIAVDGSPYIKIDFLSDGPASYIKITDEQRRQIDEIFSKYGATFPVT